MAERLRQLRLAAVNIDGVMLNDTFSPVIHHFVTSRGGAYTAGVEREIFSQSQRTAARALARAAGGRWSVAETLALYFREREAHLERDPVRMLDGAVELLHRLRGLGLRTVCYGGLDESHFKRHLGDHGRLFDGPGYVCTDAFRPGIKEITTEVFRLRYDQVLFIDDVARVGEAARELDVAFIGHPSGFPHGHQGELMRGAGVRHIAGSLDAIDEALLRTLDDEAAAGVVWSNSGALPGTVSEMERSSGGVDV